MRRLVAAVVVATAVLVAAAPAFAADSMVIRSVDTTKFPEVSISAIINGPTPDLATFNLRENGRRPPGAVGLRTRNWISVSEP